MKLIEQTCTHGAPALEADAIAALLPQVPEWSAWDGRLVRRFTLRDYHETIAFVNALAWMIHGQNHHPDLAVGYKHCTVSFTTHSAGNALSANDFICAAKADAVYAARGQA